MISRIERSTLKTTLAALIYLASGSLQLFMDGGARQQGFENISKYDGPLKFILPAWVAFCTFLVLWFLLVRGRHRILPPKASILIIFGVSLLTIIWAESAYAAFRSFYLIALCYAFTSCYTYYFSREQIIRTLCVIFYIMAIASITLATLIPSYGIYLDQEKLMWQGIFPHKNALGNFSALSFSIFIGLALIQKRKSAFIGCTLSAILVIMSNSSTSMFAMLATFFAYIALSTPALRKSLTQSRKLYITALFTISSLLVLIALSGDKLNIFDKDTSFSQRDLIWARVLLKSIESPIFGFGLDQFQSIFIYKSTDLAYITGSAVSHAHNGFIEAFFYLGIIGLLAAINLLFTLLGKDRPRDEQKANILFLTTFIIINSFEAQFLSFNPYIVILFLFIRPSGNINSASRAKLCPT